MSGSFPGTSRTLRSFLPSSGRCLLSATHRGLRLQPCACLSKMATSKVLPTEDDKCLQEVLDRNRCTLASGKEGCVPCTYAAICS